jgi:ribosomal protein S27E
MLLRCKCPGCGDLKEYVAEEVGTTADCFRCGQRFTLQPNPGRAAWQIVSATLAVLLMLGGIGARMYLRAKRAEARHEAARSAFNRLPTNPADSSDD